MKPIAIIALVFCIALSSCRQNSSAVHKVGAATIQIEESGGTVRVFSLNGAAGKSELCDTGAAQRLGWEVQRISPTRIKLTTGDVGSFDIYDDGAGCFVVPAGTFLSSNKARAVKLLGDGPNVRAQLGETSPPFTDLWVSDEVTIASVKPDELTVTWPSDIDAELKDAAGKVVGRLKAK